MNSKVLGAFAAVSGAMSLFAGSASAAGILSFSFSDLDADYTSAGPNGFFSAVGSSAGLLTSSGDVTSLTGGGGTALYGPGLAATDISVGLAVSNILANTADGAGIFSITDADGDQLVGNITGKFSALFGGGGTYFNGAMFNVTFVEGGVVDGTFNGPAGGSFNKSLGGSGIYNGFVINLFINPTGNFFVSSFSDVSSQFSGILVPAPTALGVLGLAGLALGRRRR